MNADVVAFAAWAAAIVWTVVLLAPWQPHRTRERLEAERGPAALDEVAVVIPARNEAPHIGAVLRALARQGPGLEVWVVDDESTDGTGDLCRRLAAELGEAASPSEAGDRHPLRLRVLDGAPLPPGWAGKLWALQQGFERVSRRYTLLLDADIELAPYTVPALLAKAGRSRAALVSIMATLSCRHGWERLLVPAFIFFFKLLYPFALVESGRRAGAAGGCMLVESAALASVGSFAAWRGALIDDCTLAAKFRRGGFRLSLGLSRSARSLREYRHLADFWHMVARTAYTQLGYSPALLLGTTAVMVVAFFGPVAALTTLPSSVAAVGFAGVVLMAAAYAPVVRYYGLPLAWTVTLPASAALFLAMTWGSAINYWRGTRAKWKERSYEASLE